MNEVKREIRRILLGYISFSDSDNAIVAAAPKNRLRLLGIFGGSTGARLFGIISRTQRYRLGESDPDPDRLCDTAFADLGRRTQLESAPERHAVFYAPYWYNPSVLTAECFENGEIELNVYTAVSPTVWLNTSHAMRRFEKFMPETLERQGVHVERKKREKPEKPAKESIAARVKKRFSRRDED